MKKSGILCHDTLLRGADHPFQAHGSFFQPISIQFIDIVAVRNITVTYSYLENKDSLLIPKHPGAVGTSWTVVRAAVLFGDEGSEGQVAASNKESKASESGARVFHCHINEHSERGMMSFFEVFCPEPWPPH